MTRPVSALRVNAARLRARFCELAAIGATPEGGIHRPALSEAHLAARRWFHERAASAGLKAYTDGAGNHSAVLVLDPSSPRTLLCGSHLDSVPYGGRYDGALGVVCALEVLQTVQDAGISLPLNLEAIDLTDEEGTYLGLMGSRALTGRLRPEDLAHPHGGRAALQAALAQAGLSEEGLLSSRRDPASLVAYLEVHIEQGPRLERSATDIGIVTGIVGICWYRLRFIGRADHSGTVPVAERRDAVQGASAFALAVRETVLARFAECVANVGRMDTAPGAYNVVPASVDVALEFRAPDRSRLQEIRSVLLDQAHAQAKRFGLELEVERVEAIDPAPMDSAAREAIARAAASLGLSHALLASGAGHDAQSFASLCPAGMIFVPSVGGRSHSAQESTRWEDCVNGANVLLHSVLGLAESAKAGAPAGKEKR